MYFKECILAGMHSQSRGSKRNLILFKTKVVLMELLDRYFFFKRPIKINFNIIIDIHTILKYELNYLYDKVNKLKPLIYIATNLIK